LEAYTNLRKCGEYVLLAACDEELLGKTLRHGELVFTVREEFYKGPKMPVEDAVQLMKESSIVNLVGVNVVQKAIEEGLVHPEAVLEISGVPHAQIVKM
jgi:hypothetical protein